MQYLKDNNYKAIALRDLAEYVDPVKACKLPPTSRDFSKPQEYTVTSKTRSATIYTVIVNKVAASTAKDLLEFVMPGAGPIPISRTPPARGIVAAPVVTTPNEAVPQRHHGSQAVQAASLHLAWSEAPPR